MYSTYSLALSGNSSHFLHPVVSVFHPGSVSYFAFSICFPGTSSSVCKSAGKVAASFPSSETYEVATLISSNPSKILERVSCLSMKWHRDDQLEFCQIDSGVTVDLCRILHDDKIQPTAASFSASRYANLPSDSLKHFAVFSIILRWEWSTTLRCQRNWSRGIPTSTYAPTLCVMSE
jgi:hypothetical protein